jgi:meiotic recombination protein REC8
MFFSNELLSRRDSGFGLLWFAPHHPLRAPFLPDRCTRLAATLGAKSSFKKLPRRSVLTADIAQLCGLISQPSEPLALRLSSNLMVGVVR